MKLKTTFMAALAAALVMPAVLRAQEPQTDTVRISELGLRPFTYENATLKIKEALQLCKERDAKVLLFDAGRYDIWPEGAERREWFISNTSSETECPSKVKTIGILAEDMHDLTIDGNGALLMFHGQMITMAIARSSNITVKNLHLDFERPAMSEMLVTEHTAEGTTVKFHPDSRFDIDTDGRIHLVGEGWQANTFYCTDYTPATDRFNFSGVWEVLRKSPAVRLPDNCVRFSTPSGFTPAVGRTLVVRDYIRDHVGMFIYESRDIELRDLGLHYMNGLGVVSQFTRNIAIHNIDCSPRSESGRLMAASADFLHFSGCSGRIGIYDSYFSGSQDDPINVHGTNLRIIGQSSGNRIVLRFMHGQSYGFQAFSVRDSVAVVCSETMERRAYAVVRDTRRISDREVELTLDRKLPKGTVIGSDCIENITCTPELEVRRCRFTHTHTRGTLVTTPRRVVIADNEYIKTGMSAILIEGDTDGWFESGPVCDVLIENNTFIDCGYTGGPANGVIAIHPSNRTIDPDHPVHRNIRILNNHFVTFGNPVVYAKSTADLRFEGNEVSVGYADERKEPNRKPRTGGDSSDGSFTEPFVLVGCKDVSIADNRIEGYDR